MRACDDIDGTACFELATCARHEVYVAFESEPAYEAWTRATTWDADPDGHRQLYVDDAVLRHLARVAAGLESPLLGDREITGQIRAALRRATGQGTPAGERLAELATLALRIARRARSSSGLDHAGLGLGEVASDVLRGHDLSVGGHQGPIVVLGAGMAATAVARPIAERFPGRPLVIANRSLERAQRLAAEVAGRAVTIRVALDQVASAFALLVATPVLDGVSAEGLRAALQSRPDPPLLVVDLTAERCLRGLVASSTLERVVHVELADLERRTEQHTASLRQAALRAAVSVEQDLEELQRGFFAATVHDSLESLYSSLPAWLGAMTAPLASARDDEEMGRVLRAGIKKLLHPHVRDLRQGVRPRRATWRAAHDPARTERPMHRALVDPNRV